MARSSYLQTSFLAGEWSPFFQGRADKKEYKSAMNVCRNSFPLEEGTWVRRPGFRLIAPCQFGGAIFSQSRVYPVEFTEDQPIDLVLQDGRIGFLYGNAPLLTTGIPTLDGISTSNPALLTLATNAYNWQAGDEVMFLFDQTVPGSEGLPLRGGRLFLLGSSAAGTVSNFVTYASDVSQIEQLFVAYLGRSAAPVGMTYWLNAFLGGMPMNAIAASFCVQPETLGLFPYLTNPATVTTLQWGAFLNSVFENLFNHAENVGVDPTGFAYWMAQLAAVTNVNQLGLVVRNIISGAAGTDLTTMTNRTTVASFFTQQFAAYDVPYISAAITLSHAVITATTSTSGTVTTEEAAITAYITAVGGVLVAGSGYSFTLYDAFTGAPLDGSSLGLNGVAGITVGRLAIVNSPNTGGTLAQTRIVQNQDFALILNGADPPQVLTIANFAPVDTSYSWLGPDFPVATADVELVPLTMLDGPYLDPVVDSSNTPSVVNWTGGTISGPSIVPGDGTYAGGATPGTIVAVKQPLLADVTSTQYTFWTFTGHNTQANGDQVLATAPAGPICDQAGWAPADPTGSNSQATGTFTITAGFQAWVNKQAYMPGNCVSISTQAYRCLWPCASVQPGVTTGWAQYWVAIDSGYAVTGPAAALVGFQPTDIGRMVRLLSAPADYDPTVVYGDGALVMFDNQAYVHTGEGIASYDSTGAQLLLGTTMNHAGTAGVSPATFAAPQFGTLCFDQLDDAQTGTPANPPVSSTLKPGWAPAANAFNWIWGRIVSVTSSSVAVITLDPASAPMLAPLNNFQINTWRLGAFAEGSWPACGTFYEARFWLGGAIKNRFDTSQSDGWVPGNTVLNMSPTVVTGDLDTGYSNDGTVTDACGISYTLQSKDANDIRWFNPDKDGLLAGTISGEWMIAASALSEPLTPTSIQAKQVTHYGCADIEPRKTGMGLVFIQKFMHRVMEFLPQVFVGGFIAPHLNEAAKHLSTNTLVEMAYQEELAPLLWFRTGVGNLVGALYRRTSAFLTDGTTIIGWHRHDLAPWITGGMTVASLGVNASPNGNLDALVITVADNKNDMWVEKATQVFDEDDVLADAFFLDHAKVPDTLLETSVNGVLGVRLTGLWYQAGTATVTIAGLDLGDFDLDTQTPHSSVFVPYGTGIAPKYIDYTQPGAGAYLFTPAFLAANTTQTIARNGSAAVFAGSGATATTTTSVTTTFSVQSFVPVASIDSNVDTQNTNALIDWKNNILAIPAHDSSGIREFGALTGVENYALLMDTIDSGSGTTWKNDIGAIQNGDVYVQTKGGDYGDLAKIDNTLTLTYDQVGNANETSGPYAIPYAASMAISSGGDFLCTSSSTHGIGVSQTSDGSPIGTASWVTATDFSNVAPDTNDNFYLLNSSGNIYQLLTPQPLKKQGMMLNLLGLLPSETIDPTWNNGQGTFSGLAVDAADGGLIFFAKGNFSGLSAWASGTTYAEGAMIYDGADFTDDIYTSKVAGNVGNQPDLSPTYWNRTTLQYLAKIKITELTGLTTSLTTSVISAQIEQLFVAYFGRAAAPDGMTYWVAAAQGGMPMVSIAASFGVQPESLALYPFLVNPGAATTLEQEAFLNALYGNSFNRLPTTAGVAYWLPQLVAAGSDINAIGAFVMNIISGATGADVTTLANRVTVASYFTNGLTQYGLPYNAAAAVVSSAVIAATTSDPATVTTEEAAVLTYLNGVGATDAFVTSSTAAIVPSNFTLAWAVPTTFMPNGTNDLLSQSTINGSFTFVSPWIYSASLPNATVVATTVNTVTGAVTTTLCPGLDMESAGQAYDSVSNSIVFNGKYVSTTSGAPAPLNATVTCDATWLRLFLGGTSTLPPSTVLTGLYTFAGYIQAVVGYGYTSQGQILRPISPDDTGAKAGPGFEKTRRSHVVGMLLHNTIGLQFGTSFTGSQLQPAVLKGGQDGNTGTQLAPNEMFSGHYRRPLIDDYSYDSMLAWQITRPYPASVVNIGAFIETQDI